MNWLPIPELVLEGFTELRLKMSKDVPGQKGNWIEIKKKSKSKGITNLKKHEMLDSLK